jgi:ABC-2 type transport system permease protein
MTTGGLQGHLRLIWAITAKDIVDAIKNRTTLSTILVLGFMVVFYRYMPVLTGGDDVPHLLIYDAGESELVQRLENSTALNVYTYTSSDRMKFRLAKAEIPELGLVIPSNFEEALQAGTPPMLEGYVTYWTEDEDAQDLRRYAEEVLSTEADHTVTISLAGNTIFANKDTTGWGLLASISVIFCVTMVGISLIPNLMLEEKHTHTLEVLLVSPAGSVHVVVAKALTGLFYGLIACGLTLALNAPVVMHWPLAILTAVCGALFCIALGLFLGTMMETRQQLMLVAWVFILPLLLPVFLSIMKDLLPAGLIRVLPWIPTVAMSQALRVSFAAQAPVADFAPELALICGYTVLTLGAVVWALRRSDR